MRCEGMAMVSRPFTTTDPVRFSTSPTIDLSVVVRPEPFRPRSVTSSPVPTVKSTPWRMCDSP